MPKIVQLPVQAVQTVARSAGHLAREIPIRENTVPDAFRGVPKVISPGVHKWLDVGVIGYFAGLAVYFSVRGRKGPAAAAAMNSAMVATVSLLTDYRGNNKKPISFKLHGTLDAVQGATAALGPKLFGFADTRASAFFYSQAASEGSVIALTDWDEGMRGRKQRRAA